MEQIRAALRFLLKAYFGGCFGCLGALSAMVVSAVTTFKLGETGGAYISNRRGEQADKRRDDA